MHAGRARRALFEEALVVPAVHAAARGVGPIAHAAVAAGGAAHATLHAALGRGHVEGVLHVPIDICIRYR